LSGFLIFCIGLGKKVILANTLGMQADAVFNLEVVQINTYSAWIGAIAYTFQIYFDFSGYSDMAIGLGKIMGFKLPDNFNNPYISGSITEFWRRWYIILSSWMKNYLYIPLGGNKVSTLKLYRNLIIVFLLSGFWHGASWNFIVWGAWHGTFLVLERLFLGKVLEKSTKFFAIPFTFIVIVIGWVIFRNENIEFALSVIKQMFSFNLAPSKFAINNDFMIMCALAVLFSLFAVTAKTNAIQQKVYGVNFTSNGRWLALATGVVLFYISLSFISALNFNPFIYFRF
jgi:alginate O-acetyltransferase complex protein AlgI